MIIQLKYFLTKKKCPFCPGNLSDHSYKTQQGLYRHVFRWHLLTADGIWWNLQMNAEIGIIRVFLTKWGKSVDLEINGHKHVEALLQAYCYNTFNPSLRDATSEVLARILEVRKSIC